MNAWATALAQQTGFAVRTGVLLLTDVIVIHHVPRPDESLSMPEVGIVIPSHASAVGKVLLAFDRAAANEVLSGDTIRRSMTGETITDPDALRLQLDGIQTTGIASEVEEAVIGECGLAAPLVDAAGLITGAIALVVPSGEWPVEAASLDALRSAARAISRELGADRWPPTVAP